MKNVAVLLLIAFVTFGFVGAAIAQTPASPSAQAPAASPAPSSDAKGSVSTPSGDVKGQVTIDRKTESRSESRSDDGSALPRTVTSERTTIFGLSPTAAVIIAAALLVVVILAIVAMTRSNDTYIDTSRRM
jgi:hypothetical protein